MLGLLMYRVVGTRIVVTRTATRSQMKTHRVVVTVARLTAARIINHLPSMIIWLMVSPLSADKARAVSATNGHLLTLPLLERK